MFLMCRKVSRGGYNGAQYESVSACSAFNCFKGMGLRTTAEVGYRFARHFKNALQSYWPAKALFVPQNLVQNFFKLVR